MPFATDGKEIFKTPYAYTTGLPRDTVKVCDELLRDLFVKNKKTGNGIRSRRDRQRTEFTPMSRYDILLNEPKKQVPAKEQPAATHTPTNRPADGPATRPDDAQSSSGRREFIPRGFEWGADQLRALKKLSLEEQMDGKPGNMSQMVRDALDDYLKKRAAGG